MNLSLFMTLMQFELDLSKWEKNSKNPITQQSTPRTASENS